MQQLILKLLMGEGEGMLVNIDLPVQWQSLMIYQALTGDVLGDQQSRS